MVVVYIAVIALAIWLNWYIAKQFAETATEKGHGYAEGKYFWLCFLTGIVGYLLVVALPDRGGKSASRNDELPPL